MRLHDGRDDRQTQAGAAGCPGPGAVAAGEPLEDHRQQRLRNARPVVGDGEHRVAAGAGQADGDGGAGRGVGAGVRQ